MQPNFIDKAKQNIPTDLMLHGVQRSAKKVVSGCKKFVPALALLLCLSLSGSCLAIFAYFLAGLCNVELILTLKTMN